MLGKNLVQLMRQFSLRGMKHLVCNPVVHRVVAVFSATSSPAVDSSIASVCSALHVPFFVTSSPSRHFFSISLGPSPEQLAMAVVDLATNALQWKMMVLIVHTQSGKCGTFRSQSS